MRLTHLRQADLNLLVVFSVLAEERSVSRSAERLFLSQPAVSRALQRLRETFHDDLLVRTANGYEPTTRGQRLVQELAAVLPRLDRMLAGGEFDPAEEPATFRIAANDNAAAVFGPALSRQLQPWFGNVMLRFVGWHDGTFEDLEHGRADLSLNADDGHTPERLHREALYDDDFVCVVARSHALSRRVTLKQYASARHITVAIREGQQTIPDQRLAARGHRRVSAIEVPYFSAALRCVAGTNLIATAPRRLVKTLGPDAKVKVLDAPRELGTIPYLMTWHPRADNDAAHQWLRAMVRKAAATLPTLKQLRRR